MQAAQPMFDVHPNVKALPTRYCPGCGDPIKVDYDREERPLYYNPFSGNLMSVCRCGLTLDRRVIHKMG